jgi:hypothetical protein
MVSPQTPNCAVILFGPTPGREENWTKMPAKLTESLRGDWSPPLQLKLMIHFACVKGT